MNALTQPLEQACANYRQYLLAIVEPSMRDLQADIDARRIGLPRAFGANLFVAHAVDYIQAIRFADDIQENRKELVQRFDQLFSVDGARLRNRKFELIDAINNALKHIRLDPKRYQALERSYGPISFQSLLEEDGRVLCILDGYRFDYARVVLLPAYEALTSWNFEITEDILAFARGGWEGSKWSSEDELMASNDPADAIDQMIVACHPSCENCGEAEQDCYCAQFVFEGEQGRFEPLFRSDFDFDSVMSRISGAYSPHS